MHYAGPLDTTDRLELRTTRRLRRSAHHLGPLGMGKGVWGVITSAADHGFVIKHHGIHLLVTETNRPEAG
jgi:hypothetical protein